MRWAVASCLALVATGCAFNFEVTSQRTALENQVMGAYKELDDELILVSSVRAAGVKGVGTRVKTVQRPALDARLNQDFNRDDIEELKDLGVIGESATGTVVLLPTSVGSRHDGKLAPSTLARTLIDEENHDRDVIWQRIIAANPNLAAKDLPAVRRTYAKLQREQSRPGQWVESETGSWQQTANGKAGT